PEADAEERDVLLARPANRLDLAFGAAHAEPAGHQHAGHVRQQRLGAALFDDARVDVVELDLRLVGDAAVRERFVQALVALGEPHALADAGDAHPAARVLDDVDDALPALEPLRARPDVERLDDPVFH